ncbi:MAG TPA: hypothetical protein VL309_04270 [Vicinamibacterales bacterium]|nr:hypothetical protein [Vicinamibacterales bacterium]
MKASVQYVFPALLALYYPFCTPPMRATMVPWQAPLGELWQRPSDLESRDLYGGPWGTALAPDPNDVYVLVERKQQGTNPGVTVRDSRGREWHVKQPPHNDQGAEGPIEVTLSRVLSAVGYHQPPVYFLPSLRIKDVDGIHEEPGGRFRLSGNGLNKTGSWSWQENPFVGMRPYQGLLVMMMMFDSSDLKNENNAIYDVTLPQGGRKRWYVVRDLGTALGETGRIAPRRGDPDIFEREPFILDVNNGLVRFNYHGWHQELFGNISKEDVAWASQWLALLSDAQWTDAFRAGGFDPGAADRFIGRLHKKIAQGARLGDRDLAQPPPATSGPDVRR